MKTIPRRFFRDYADPELSMNPFVGNLTEYLSKKGKTKGKSSSDIEEYLCDDSAEVYAEPEEVLDFDAALFPDHLQIFLYLGNRLEDFEILFVIKRVGKEMLYEIVMGPTGHSYFTYPFNISRIHLEMNNLCEEHNFIPDLWDPADDSHSMPFYFIAPALGNMLQTFNEAWAKLETLYLQSRNKIISEAKEMG